MHVLVSNLEAEIAAFRGALGPLADRVRVVENNLSVLSLLASDLAAIRSLVITEHQDEGVNVETQTFVRNLANRILDSVEIIVVGPLFAHLESPTIRAVPTIEDAAAMIREQAQLQPVEAAHESSATAPSSNGHASFAPADTATIAVADRDAALESSAAVLATREMTHTADPTTHTADSMTHDATEPGQEAHESSNGNGAAPMPGEPEATATDSVAHESSPATPDMTHTHDDGLAEPARSLADDIRDWTERNEQQRSQNFAADYGTSLWQRLAEMLPANRRARAEEADLDRAIRAPRLSRCHSIAVISPKGGVGKSFLTYMIGNFLAEVRGDKVVAIDTNPDFGTLADQVRGRESQTVSTLLDQLGNVRHYSDLRRFTSKVESRLEVLAAPADPDVMATISAHDYSLVHEQLLHYYDTVLFDCGTGFRDDITRFALQRCDQIVLVSAPLFITTGIVIRALGYLNQIGCDLSRVTLAINQVRREKPLDIEYMRSRFGSRLNAIVEIPFDLQLNHATDRGEFSIDRTQQGTRTSIKRLVSELVKHFE
jgi:MinD-like ATPase involved in chromosome partitioning or flagellar assembly